MVNGGVNLGIDIGGTFTDFIAYDRETRALRAWKCLSRAGDPTAAILEGLTLGGVPRDTLRAIRLGTTVATNALLEGKGAVVGYITTAGFRDIPFIGRGDRPDHYDLTWVKPKPFVKRRHSYEVPERIGARGDLIRELDEDAVRELARHIRAEGEIEAVALMFMHSYVDPRHERRARAILAEELPDIPLSISYDVLPKWKEYLRASTTICDAFVKPVVRSNLGSLQQRLREAGVAAPIVVMRSNGGEMTLDAAAEMPIQLAVSGPTGGVIAAKSIGSLLGIHNILTLDMGGTSADISTIVEGQVRFTTDFQIEFGRPIAIPMIDIRTIGAGGGSLARVDAGGMLIVGPESAGAMPGPVCYGRGGEQVTVTDCNLALGRIAADNFLGGTMRLDEDAALLCLDRLASEVRLGREETADAVVRIANNAMVGALHTVLTEQGLDPREFTLMTFGGAGPLHICDLLEEASIDHGLVPIFPGQFSAFGFTLANARVDRHRTAQLVSAGFEVERAEAMMADLERECRADLAGQGHRDGVLVERFVEMRYVGQNHELTVPLSSARLEEAEQAALWDAFNQYHHERFGFRLADAIEVINFIVTASAPTGRIELPRLARAEAPAEPLRSRPVWFGGGTHDTPVYRRGALLAGHELAGPALVEEDASVTVVLPGWMLKVDDWGNLHITRTKETHDGEA
jgi:N-methylhydantoinase A